MSTHQSTSVRDSAQDRRRAREDRGIASASAQMRTDRLPPAPRERRPMLAALAVLLIVGGAATAGLLALRADDRIAVLVAGQGISAGELITEEMLTTTSVAAEGTLLIPAARAEVLAGKYARVSITEGQLLDTAMLTDSSTLQPGTVAVGASLAAGRMPASGLEPGDIVQLVQVDGATGVVLVPDALVSSWRSHDDGGMTGSGGVTVTLIVDQTQGADIANVAAAGDLAVVLVSRGEPIGGR